MWFLDTLVTKIKDSMPAHTALAGCVIMAAEHFFSSHCMDAIAECSFNQNSSLNDISIARVVFCGMSDDDGTIRTLVPVDAHMTVIHRSADM